MSAGIRGLLRTQSYYNPRDSSPLTREGYQKNQLSFWGGKNGDVAGSDAAQTIRCTTASSSARPGDSPARLPERTPASIVSGARGPWQFAKIIDGTSKTFMLGEKYVRNDSYEGGGKSDDKGWIDGWDPDAIRSTCFSPYQDSDRAISSSR